MRRHTGYLPEVPVLYDWMTVAEIGWFAAAFHLDIQGTANTYQYRYTELTRGFDLPLTKKIKTLSKGMRAKVSLSLVLASDSSLLILDEPTSGLDVLVRREFLESMVDLAGAGRTVLLSSHQISEVERVASHVALLHKGKLMLAEPLEELKSQTFLLSVTFASRDHPTTPPEGRALELIDANDASRQAHWLVRATDRSACEVIRALPGVEGLEIETPSLEEIYIGYMCSSAGATGTLGNTRGVRSRCRKTADFPRGADHPCTQGCGGKTHVSSGRSGSSWPWPRPLYSGSYCTIWGKMRGMVHLAASH